MLLKYYKGEKGLQSFADLERAKVVIIYTYPLTNWLGNHPRELNLTKGAPATPFIGSLVVVMAQIGTSAFEYSSRNL